MDEVKINILDGYFTKSKLLHIHSYIIQQFEGVVGINLLLVSPKVRCRSQLLYKIIYVRICSQTVTNVNHLRYVVTKMSHFPTIQSTMNSQITKL